MGYVLGATEELVLLHRLDDGISLDGYEVVRARDVTACTGDFPHAPFYARALELKGDQPRPAAGLDLSSMEALQRTASERFPLLVLHRERTTPGECSIGRVRTFGARTLRLRWLSPDAEWTEPDEVYSYASITRVELGTRYDTALALVAGLVERGRSHRPEQSEAESL